MAVEEPVGGVAVPARRPGAAAAGGLGGSGHDDLRALAAGDAGLPADWRVAWTAVGASVAGASHVLRGAPGQDAHLWLVRADGLLVLAVADGAGSAARGCEGARIAVERVVEVLDGSIGAGPAGDREPGGPDLPEDPEAARALFVGAFAAARRLVDARAEAEGAETREFACTLSCAVATGERLLAAQVGDGLVVACGKDGVWSVVLGPRRGEYANETTFLTAGAGLDALDVAVVTPAPVAVAATTDGLLRLASDLAAGRPHTPFFEPLVAWLAATGSDMGAGERLAAFLTSPRVAARADDDLTLVLALRDRVD